MKKLFVTLLVLLLLIPIAALCELQIECSGEDFPIGAAVDFSVEPGDDPVSCRYTLLLNGKKIYEDKKPDGCFQLSYRPVKPGTYTLKTQVVYRDKHHEEAECTFTADTVPESQVIEEEKKEIYSQKDGTWAETPYRKSDLETAGCAVFTLSHALHRMGITGEETEPAALAKTYAYCLVIGGTNNGRLIRTAAEDFSFITESALIKNPKRIKELFREGAMFSFSVAVGHIALAADLSEDGKKVLIIDSAPTATFERLKKSKMYRLDSSGNMQPVTDLSEFPGARRYLTTRHYDGLSYYLDLNYVAKRGVRLIQPYQLSYVQNGEKIPAEMVTFGAVDSVIEAGDQRITVPTRELQWKTDGCEMQAAWLPGKKAVKLTDADGKKIARLPGCMVLPVLAIEDDRICVRYKNSRGYLSIEDAELVPIDDGSAVRGVLTLKDGKKSKANIKVRYGPAESIAATWKTGKTVAMLQEEDGYTQVEADGYRYWIQSDYLAKEE